MSCRSDISEVWPDQPLWLVCGQRGNGQASDESEGDHYGQRPEERAADMAIISPMQIEVVKNRTEPP